MQENSLKSKIFACLKAGEIARIRGNLSVLDLVPEKFLKQYCEQRNLNYDFMVRVFNLCYKISNQLVNTTLSQNRVFYDCFKSRTGRLTTRTGSLPILTLKKSARKQILPTNDLFLKLDYNAAEIRVLLGLLGKPQPTEDIHQHHQILGNFSSREQVKKEFFRWLYNLGVENEIFSSLYNREELLYEFWLDGWIQNPFGRCIQSDEFHAINYLLQSTTVDLVHEQSLKIETMLNSCESMLAFLIHDEVVLDIKTNEWLKLKNIPEVFQNTRFGRFPISIKVGKNLGEMKKIEI